MSRTKGSGWGGAPINWQICPLCGKKKCYYNPIQYVSSFKCTSCKERFNSSILKNETFINKHKLQ